MTDERIDAETVAAFLDGRASPREREAVLLALTRSKEAYADFLEAAAVHRELTGASVPAPSLGEPKHESTGAPSGIAWRSSRWRFVPLLAAAGIAAVVVGRLSTGERAPRAIQIVQQTRLTSDSGPGVLAFLGDSWNQPGWSVSRGSDAAASTRARAFRAGARYAGLELASQVADSAAVIEATRSLTQLLDGIEAGAPMASRFREFASRPDFGGSAPRAEAAAQLRSLTGAEVWFDLGAWTEAARLSVAARQVRFFAPDGGASGELRRIARALTTGTSREDPEVRAVIGALAPLLEERAWSDHDLPLLNDTINTVIVAAAT